MTEQPAHLPRWLLGAFLGLLVLPFYPYWIDFEQVRRGLLLLLCGVTLLFVRLPRVSGEKAWWAFTAVLGVAALISVRSLQPYEAVYRIGHYVALWIVLRIGAAAPGAIGTPMAILLVATSLFGLLQRLDWVAIGTYGSALEPVSVFGNTNVASEWTAVAAMAVAVLLTDRRRLQLTAVFLAGAYLVVNGSRSGQIALAIGLMVLVLKQRKVATLVTTGMAVGGAAIGLVLSLALTLPEPEDHAAKIAIEKRATHTIAVRLEIAKGCGELLAERPLFGFGPGQFQVQYPRVRSNDEIELSSHGRTFASEVRTAHDDWLELLVEGGLPILFLFAGALFALQRGQRNKIRLMPLFVLLLLMFARSPLANAPAICAALLPVATALPRGSPASRSTAAWQLWSQRGLGLLLAVMGLLPVIANSLFAPYVSAVASGRLPSAVAAANAHQWMWWEPRWLQILAQEHMKLGHAKAAQKAAAMASKLRPHDPNLLLLVGSTLSNEAKYDEAAAVAKHGLQYDPDHTELRVLRSTSLLLTKHYDEAITAVTVNPHPTLRAQLRNHFAALAGIADLHKDPIGAARCRMERTFFDILKTLGDSSPRALSTTTEHIRIFTGLTAAAGRNRDDLRFYLLNAVHLDILGNKQLASDLAKNARLLKLVLPNWQRQMLGDKLAPLLEHEGWFELLRRRPRDN